MRLMKIKYIVIIPIILIMLLFISCKKEELKEVKFDNDINVYTDTNDYNRDNITFVNKCDFKNEDNILIISFELSIQIKLLSNGQEKYKLSEPNAYGNDIDMEEDVLSNYDSKDKDKTAIFNDKEFIVSSVEQPGDCLNYINFFLVIKDGNPECKYRIDFKFNNVILSVHSYDEGYELDKFLYVHDPSKLDSVLLDAEYDPNAVFGYKPNTTGSLKQFAEYDWFDEEAVNGYKNDRITYINENDGRLKALENTLRSQNKSIEEIARACSNLRNNIRLEQYKDDPEGLANLKQRNLEKYGHEEGPLPDELYVKYRSWEKVLEKCYSVNRGMDACCGVYDMYYYLYNEFAY